MLPLRAALMVAILGTLGGQATGAQIDDLGSLPGLKWSSAEAISDDGKTLVGRFRDAVSVSAFLWTQSNGITRLPLPAGVEGESGAWGLSGNGSVAVGYAGALWQGATPMRWLDGVASPLTRIPGESVSGSAMAISRDGSGVLGVDGPAGGQGVIYWDHQGVPREIFPNIGSMNDPRRMVISSNGLAAAWVGWGSSTPQRWTPETGAVPVRIHPASYTGRYPFVSSLAL
jgi:uncharacterized membrane protein